MPEAAFMPPAGQSDYAFPAGQDDPVTQQNQQIDSSFAQQRQQRAFMQGLSTSMSKEAQQTARRQEQQQAQSDANSSKIAAAREAEQQRARDANIAPLRTK